MLQSCIIYSPTALTYRAEKVLSEDILRVAKDEARLTHRGIAYHHHLQEGIKRFHDADLANKQIIITNWKRERPENEAIIPSRSQAAVRVAVQQNVLQLPFCFQTLPVRFPSPSCSPQLQRCKLRLLLSKKGKVNWYEELKN